MEERNRIVQSNWMRIFRNMGPINLGIPSIILAILCMPFIDAAFPFLPTKQPVNIGSEATGRQDTLQFSIGPCKWIFNGKCPSADIQFYLYTNRNQQDRQYIHVDETWDKSNLSTSYFNAHYPVKIILHGYNSDMFLTPLIQMKEEYFDRGNYNLFFIDWKELARAPCYPSAAHNTKYAGQCIGQLINRLRDGGTTNIHIIGFSLGAHVAAFAANQANGFQVPRITALDPALPLFITAAAVDKLDATDAQFVDVIHSNAFVQGQIERCGTVDFYMNGGIIQPGCLGFGSNPFACSHHRAADYFTESIKSERGFWGWPCGSYYSYLLGMCPRSNELHLAGEDCRTTTKGMFLIATNSESPFASGQWTLQQSSTSNVRRDPFYERIDAYGKLESAFNYADSYKKIAFGPISTVRPFGEHALNNHINQNEYEVDEDMRHNIGHDSKYAVTTERWRQNDKFILVENPLALAINDNNRSTNAMILHHHQQSSNDEFQFPKVMYYLS